MDKLISEQSLIAKNIKKIHTNFGKDSSARKTKVYLESKLESLYKAWSSFEINHEELLKIEGITDTKYIQEKYFDGVETLYEHTRDTIEDYMRDLLERGKISERLEKQALDIKKQKALIKLTFDCIEKIKTELPTKASPAYCKQRVHLLENYWQKIFTVHSEIISIGSFKDEYFDQNMFSEVEDRYHEIMIGINEASKANPTTTEDNHTNILSSATKDNGIKLPRVDIPAFDGNYLKWPSFKDLFVELIVKNKSISNTEKLFYLKSNLKGETGDLIRHLSVTTDNFITAWDILQKRYDNKRIIVATQLKALVNQPELKKESFVALKGLHDTTTECLAAIKNLGIDISNWDAIIVFLLTQKLDRETHMAYEHSIKNPREVQSIEDFLHFIEARFQGLEVCEPSLRKQSSSTQKSASSYYNSMGIQLCSICNKQHSIYTCEQFAKMNTKQRWGKVKNLQLCTNCLQNSHKIDRCKSAKRCKICNRQHHSLLHITRDAKVTEQKMPIIENADNTKVGQAFTANEITQIEQNNKTVVLLPTALVKIKKNNGETIELRALIDQGAECSFITEHCAQLLGLKRIKTHALITGIGQTTVGNITSRMDLIISPRFPSKYKLHISALILKNLTRFLPSEKVISVKGKYLNTLTLADPDYQTPGPVQIILGAEALSQILLTGMISGGANSPIAQQTQLGWILSGTTLSQTKQNRVHCFVSEVDIGFDLRRFWEIEELQKEAPLTKDELACEKFYRSTVRRGVNGRYIVRLPLKEDPETSQDLSDTREIAIARLRQMEKKFQHDKKFEALYKNFMNEYISLGHMVRAEENLGRKYYLPHHAVFKDSTTSQIRVVFDASAKQAGKKSLNDIMLTGPQIQRKLFQILLKWRRNKIAFKADIEKMYRQIKVDVRDRDLQRVVWREHQDDPIVDLVLTTVTYGESASPFLAIRTIQQLTKDHEKEFPEAVEILREDCYVDDVTSGADSVEEAINICSDLIQLLKKGGFNLRKWTCNSKEVMGSIPRNLREVQDELDFDNSKDFKALGVVWNSSKDIFKISVNTDIEKPGRTKREIASQAAKIFDPIGLLAPITINIKILLQSIWELEGHWDDPVPENIIQKWIQIKQGLPCLVNVEIPRWIGYTRQTYCELHGSEKAYSATVYIRVITDDGVRTSLLTAKTKVAPLRSTLTLPKLELSGAVLLAQLIRETVSSLQIENLEYFVWTDSSIVLNWLNDHPSKWKTFVANRVAEIQSLTDSSRWFHVRSEENPADVASRGILPPVLKTHTLWWNGPTWLKNRTISYPALPNQVLNLELRKTAVHVSQTNETTESNMIQALLRKHSSLSKVQRITAYVMRFINNIKSRSKKQKGLLTMYEFRSSLKILIRTTQSEHFATELENLNKQLPLDKRSRLLSLAPFMDSDGILRVGGRLQNSQLPYNRRHPIILPHKGALTSLILDEIHNCTLHGSNSLMLNVLRQQYWMLNAPKAIKGHIHNCVRCHRYKAQSSKQMMGMLPKSRATTSPPFSQCGIDYAGPIDILLSRTRGSRSMKGYLAIFVCLATKAIHIEVVTDLTAKAFIAAFRRMTSRRGPISDVYSDNGTNFVGASKIISQLHNQDAYREEVNNSLISTGTQWHFIPPASPHFGGLWEAGVKSIKYHLRRVIGEHRLTYEELTTLTTQIEACLNSRPLCPMNNEPDNFDILTPGHFLTGSPLLTVPEQLPLMDKRNFRDKWDELQRMHQEFWKKWSTEYLGRLQQRPKWAQSHTNLRINDLVLIKEDNLPPSRWLLGRVLETHPGTDGMVRVVTVKTHNGTSKRPIVKLSLLPIDNPNPETQETLEKEKDPSETNLKRKQSDFPDKEKDTKKGRTRTNNYSTSPPASSQFTLICLFAFLFTVVFGNHIPKPFNITRLANFEGIYFDKTADIHLCNNEWNLLIYYNLSSYWREFDVIRNTVKGLNDLCKEEIQAGLPESLCSATIWQLNQQVLKSESVNGILFLQNDQSLARRKRGAPFEIIGTITNKLFGILDQNYADHIEEQLDNIMENEKVIKDLMKNQTSVIENSIHLAKHNFEIVNIQMKEVTNQLDRLKNYTKGFEEESKLVTTFNSIAVLITLSIMNFKSVQESLLFIISDTLHGKPNNELLTPRQLQMHLRMIREHLSANLRLPIGNEEDSLLSIYRIMHIQFRFTGKRVLFNVKIPLLYSESLALYKMIPLPIIRSGKQISISTTSSHIAINHQRDRYTPLDEMDIKSCLHLSDENLICTLNKSMYTLRSNQSKCEIDLLNNKQILSPDCVLTFTKPKDSWTKLHTSNTWLYSINHVKRCDIFCGGDQQIEEFEGNGIITLKSGCKLVHPTFSIDASSTITSEHKFVIPDNRILSIHLESTFNRSVTDNSTITHELNIHDFDFLDNRLHEHQKKLDELPTKSNQHQVHHYAASFSPVILIVLLYVIVKAYKVYTSKPPRQPRAPRPAPRRSVQIDSISLPSFHCEPAGCAST